MFFPHEAAGFRVPRSFLLPFSKILISVPLPLMASYTHSSSRPRLELLCRFWPFLLVMFVGLVFFLHFDLLLSESALDFGFHKDNPGTGNSRSVEEAIASKLPWDASLALVHYASSNITPQQTKEEIGVTAKILQIKSPCNFLVFGLGFDSLLWATLNLGGRTVFLEEDRSWIAQVAEKHLSLKAYHVNYSTILTEADKLLLSARADKENCGPIQNLVSSKCKLAMKGLPLDVYATEWDVIMIDAPRGYFPEAPGRMTAIFSAGVMARGGGRRRDTDVLVHDVDREVERDYSKEFLCSKNLVVAVGKLWHFRVEVGGFPRSNNFC